MDFTDKIILVTGASRGVGLSLSNLLCRYGAKVIGVFNKTKKEFMKVLEVNLVGTFLVCKYASLIMNNEVIINISSTDASDTFSTYSMAYAASKAGVENITKNLANRLPNIKICALAPNWIDTEIVLNMNQEYLKNELKRIGQKDLISKENVVIKIIEMIVSDDIVSGDIIRMVSNNE